MKFLWIRATNFGSYKYIEYEYPSTGVNIIQGPTGSGKSTFCEIPAWIVSGRTSKSESVNDIISWKETTTTGTIKIKTKEIVYITRTRGKNNDLYYQIESIESDPIRGKDLLDTQKLIYDLLNITEDLFLSSIYYHEFSASAQFFTTTAKGRREFTENITDINNLIKIADCNKNFKKKCKEDKEKIDSDLLVQKTILKNSFDHLNSLSTSNILWESNKEAKILELKNKIKKFKSEKNKKIEDIIGEYAINKAQLVMDIEDVKKSIIDEKVFDEKLTELNTKEKEILTRKCDKCGSPMKMSDMLLIRKQIHSINSNITISRRAKPQIDILNRRLEKLDDDLKNKVREEQERPNLYEEQLKEKKEEKNPYNIEKAKEDFLQNQEIVKENKELIKYIKNDINNSNILDKALSLTRMKMINNVLEGIQDKTNYYLDTIFDGIFSIKLIVLESDKIDLEIFNGDILCSFTQLSKGQRQILKLCFAIACIRVIDGQLNYSSNTLFIDEACDGMSEEYKNKVYKLLLTLTKDYENIFIVDHSLELKEQIDNKLTIEIKDGKSEILSS